MQEETLTVNDNILVELNNKNEVMVERGNILKVLVEKNAMELDQVRADIYYGICLEIWLYLCSIAVMFPIEWCITKP